jgi:DNA-binding transcriptional MocR family regulator
MYPLDVPTTRLAGLIQDRSARGIAADVAALIRRGELPTGAQLPTVRALAAELGVSPATVSEAWVLLRSRRAIEGRGRAGMRVIGPPSTPHPARFERTGNFGDRLAVDLTLAGPDPALLPDLSEALQVGLTARDLNDYRREAITPELRAAVAPRWPFPAAGWLATGGGYEALVLLLEVTVVPGDRVAVEEPTAPRLLDILDSVGATVLPVACDERGPRPESLAAALTKQPAAFVFQPRAQSPTGSALDAERCKELAALLRGAETLVIEDDGAGEVSSAVEESLGRLLPHAVVRVRSFSKSHGPDLRLAVVGGAAAPIERARTRQSFGTGWTSRILQRALAHLLDDPAAQSAVRAAREAYAWRRDQLVEELAARGVVVTNRDGLSVWIPVRDEQSALVTLATHGVAVSPGSRFFHSRGTPHIRAAVSNVRDDHARLAEMLALAADDYAETREDVVRRVSTGP